jgi:hypothetical protein
MDALLDRTRGKTDLAAMKQHFADPDRGICVGKASIDLMVYDTTHRTPTSVAAPTMEQRGGSISSRTVARRDA